MDLPARSPRTPGRCPAVGRHRRTRCSPPWCRAPRSPRRPRAPAAPPPRRRPWPPAARAALAGATRRRCHHLPDGVPGHRARHAGQRRAHQRRGDGDGRQRHPARPPRLPRRRDRPDHAGVAHGGRGHGARERARRPRCASSPPRASDRCARRCGSSSARRARATPAARWSRPKVQTRKLLFEGGRTATVAFYVRGVAPVDVAVDVVRASDRVAVAHFAMPADAPGSVHSVDWDGTIAGVAQPDGRYVFQVAAAIAGGAGARAAQAGAPRAPPRELLARPRRLPDRRPAHLRRGLRRAAQRPRPRGPGRHGRLRPPARWRRKPAP